LHRAFLPDVLMVPSSAITITADVECLSCDGFSLGDTILFGSLEFIADFFGDLNLSSQMDVSNAAAMGSTRCGPLSSLQAMTGDSTKEFHMTLDGEGALSLPSPRRHGTGAPLAPTTTMSWPENTPTTQAMTMIPPQLTASRSATDLPFEQ
jgi:hypothetical protein